MTLEVETGRSCYPFAPESQRVRISAQIYLLTLNQRVHGSSPCAPTIETSNINMLQLIYLKPVQAPRFVSAPCPQTAGPARGIKNPD